MKDLLAKKPSELAICLKLLYARGIDFNVELEEVNGKIQYQVWFNADDELEAELAETYRILIT